jgi:hypothetical protein
LELVPGASRRDQYRLSEQKGGQPYKRDATEVPYHSSWCEFLFLLPNHRAPQIGETFALIEAERSR